MKAYVPPPTWTAPPKIIPSESFYGEASTTPIHEAVGQALSTWEHMESGLIKLFQLLCETKSFAACRAYGTLDSAFSRQLALTYAAEEFFTSRDKDDFSKVKTLIKFITMPSSIAIELRMVWLYNRTHLGIFFVHRLMLQDAGLRHIQRKDGALVPINFIE